MKKTQKPPINKLFTRMSMMLTVSTRICLRSMDQAGTLPKLSLCARICLDQRNSYDEPPDLPAFKSEPVAKKLKESLTETLTGAFALAVSGGKLPQSVKSQDLTTKSSPGVAISPGKAVELWMKNYEQLWYLQLFENGILSDKEYSKNILEFLRKINKLNLT